MKDREENHWHIEFVDMAQRLRFVLDNIDSISRRKDCCAQLEVIVDRLDDLILANARLTVMEKQRKERSNEHGQESEVPR